MDIQYMYCLLWNGLNKISPKICTDSPHFPNLLFPRIVPLHAKKTDSKLKKTEIA